MQKVMLIVMALLALAGCGGGGGIAPAITHDLSGTWDVFLGNDPTAYVVVLTSHENGEYWESTDGGTESGRLTLIGRQVYWLTGDRDPALQGYDPLTINALLAVDGRSFHGTGVGEIAGDFLVDATKR
jgi:hypothetical protein